MAFSLYLYVMKAGLVNVNENKNENEKAYDKRRTDVQRGAAAQGNGKL